MEWLEIARVVLVALAAVTAVLATVSGARSWKHLTKAEEHLKEASRLFAELEEACEKYREYLTAAATDDDGSDGDEDGNA